MAAKEKRLKLISWNVNGIRAAVRNGLLSYLKEESPDVICFQETKAEQEQVAELEWPGDYQQFWNSAEKKGYSGTAIFTRVAPLSVTNGMGDVRLDKEGRVINAEFNGFHLVTVYTPNSQRELARLDYRTLEWDVAFRKHLKKLEKDKPVIFCGDLNVAHQEIDLANPRTNTKNAGFTIEERNAFTELLDSGFVDTFREFEKGGGHYSWWSYRAGARKRNVGWRIDYFGISEVLRPKLKNAFIRPDVMGSDHCPVGIEIQAS